MLRVEIWMSAKRSLASTVSSRSDTLPSTVSSRPDSQTLVMLNLWFLSILSSLLPVMVIALLLSKLLLYVCLFVYKAFLTINCSITPPIKVFGTMVVL